MELNPTQITELAKPFVGMLQTVEDFFKDPSVEQRYKAWHIQKYGFEPKVGVDK